MGRPGPVAPAGREMAGMPAVEPGPVLRMVVRKTGTSRPLSSVVSSSPSGGAGSGTVGYTRASSRSAPAGRSAAA